jgi:hypothetical protein
MIKYGCMALAIACSIAAPAVQAQGNFFVAGQTGRATYDKSSFDEDSANTRALSAGYRWQAGSVTQVGVEIGAGKVDEIGSDYFYSNGAGYSERAHIGMDATYRHVGANARFNFGSDSRWFAVVRGGLMRYKQNVKGHYIALLDGSVIASGSGSDSDSGSGAYFGAGIGFDITKNFNVNVMRNGYAYSDYNSDNGNGDEDIGTAATTTLGLEVRF